MSASLVHFAVCDDVARVLGLVLPEEDEAGMALQRYPNFARLGSIGPDLPYFENAVTDGFKMLLDINLPLQACGYLLHTKDPGHFAARMFHILEADGREGNTAREPLLAFALGYLTHMATDHVIHPFVNRGAGKYYLSKDNQTRHREIEIYQDVELFRQMYSKGPSNKKLDVLDEFRKKDLQAKIDVPNEGFWSSQGAFRLFLQRAFLETHGLELTEKQVENWIDGASLTLRVLNKNVGPYTRALHKPDAALHELACPGTEFFDPKDQIVNLVTRVWKKEAAPKSKTTEPGSISAEKAMGKGGQCLYAQAVCEGVRYIQMARTYVANQDYEQFKKDLPNSDLSDPGSGEKPRC